GCEVARILLGELGDDEEAAATAPPALRELDRGAHDRLDQRCDPRSAPREFQQLALATRQEADVTIEDRDEDALARAEVVVQRAPVALPGLLRDLQQRRVGDAVLGERAGRGVEELLPRPRRVRWHGRMLNGRPARGPGAPARLA